MHKLKPERILRNGHSNFMISLYILHDIENLMT